MKNFFRRIGASISKACARGKAYAARQIEADTALPPFEAATRRAEPEAEDLRRCQQVHERILGNLARLEKP